jgi:hypothetical protein
MISLAWAIFRGSRALQAATAILLGWIAWNGNNAYQRHVGKEQLRAASIEAGRRANAKNEVVRRAAKQPGAFDRLRADSCRDCK